MYRVITHIHTKYSHDSMLPFDLLYKKCLKKGIDYIAITEHNNICGAVEFQKYCLERGNRPKVIVGEEIMTSEGEIIGLYLHDEIEPFQTPEQTIAQIKEQGGIVYVPHPYDLKRHKTILKEEAIRRLAAEIDCIECHNGRNISEDYDVKQNEIAEKYEIKKVIGSDAHTIFEVGNNFMESELPLDTTQDFSTALDTVELYPSPCKKWYHQLTRIDRVIKMVQKGDFDGLCQIVIRKIKGRKP